MYLSLLQPNKSLFDPSDACFDAILFIISTSYSHSNASIGWGSTREPCKKMKMPCIWTIYTTRPSNRNADKILQYYKYRYTYIYDETARLWYVF